MRETQPNLTIDEAVAHFTAIIREELGPSDPESAKIAAPTATEREATYLRFAETIVGLICPEPRACSIHSCRRASLCRHYREMHAGLRRAHQQPSRRSPGAQAVRHAMWLFMTYAANGARHEE